MAKGKQEEFFRVDELNLRILEELLRDPDLTFLSLAGKLKVDQRTVAKRIGVMKRMGVIKSSLEVDWNAWGVRALAYVGSTTSSGEAKVNKFYDFIRSDPRIVEAFQTLGSHEYLFKTLEKDIEKLRDSVLHDLEPLTAEMGTSLVTSNLKKKDYSSFIRYLRETKYPRSRTSG